jgi:replicative DNA helicase
MTPIQQLAAIDMEQDVLSLMICKPYEIPEVRAELKADDFFRPAHSLIYSCLLDMYRAGEPIDMISVTEKMKMRGDLDKVGGFPAISYICNRTMGVGGVSFYLSTIKERARRKHAIALMDVAVAEAADPAVDFDLHGYVSKLAEVMKERFVPERSVKAMFSDLLQGIENRAKDDRNNIRMMTGIAGLDSLTHGFGKKDLILIAARPSMGKSALAGQIALNAVVGQGLNILYASLEMSEEQILGRMLANLTDIDSLKILYDSDFANTPDYQRVKENATALSEVGLYIRDVGMNTPQAIYAQAQQIQARHGLDSIIIDHVHLMKSGIKGVDGNQYEKIKEISRSLKEMAKEFNIPVIALAQLSRGVEQRNDKHPVMSDLRDSGSLEEDADKVIMLYREQYYSREALPVDVVDISVQKNRMGGTGTVSLEFQKQFSKFKPLALAGTAEPKGFKPPV